MQLQKLPGKGDGGRGKKVSLCCCFWLTRRSRVRGEKRKKKRKKKRFEASYSTSNKILLIARHIMTTGFKNAFKVGRVKFANSLSPPSIVKKVRTGSKSSPGT